MNILIIDNYDSFTFNLYQYVGELLDESMMDFTIDVYRNDKITLQEIKDKQYDRIIISPGPGDPGDKKYFGVCKEVLLTIGKTIPVLGVCLGMQGIAYYFGGKVIKAKLPMHGKSSRIIHDAKGIFKNIQQEIDVMRYHSLVADSESIPDCLEVSAVVKESEEIMGLRHKKYPIEGIQFHPESFATDGGNVMLRNFLFV